MHDVIIVGGGPSGLNAARRLGAEGLDVVVFEKKQEIGKNVICTGIVGKHAFKEFDLSKDSILTEINKIKFVSPFSSLITYEHSHPFACIVDREKFDKYLSYSAQKRGVDIRLDNKVVDISMNKNFVEVHTKREGKYYEKSSAKAVLIATGIDYNLHKKVGLGHPKGFLNGVQVELRATDVDCPSVFVGKHIALGAFAWAVPISKETIKIGMMVEKNPKLRFIRFMKKYFPDKMRDLDSNQIKFKTIAQGLVSPTYNERVLAVGEAASQVKTTTGGGIYFGLICSEIASRLLLQRFEEGCFTADALAEYEKLWKKAIQREISMGYYARRICTKLKDTQIEKIFQIAQSDGIIPLIKEKGDFDWHSELILALIKRLPLLKIHRKRIIDHKSDNGH